MKIKKGNNLRLVNIVVKDSNGHVFERDKARQIVIGTTDIPSGLQIAIESMKKGEKSIIKVRADYAYGAEGNNHLKIPPNTDLIYEIQLNQLEKGKEAHQISTIPDKIAVGTRRKTEGNDLLNQGKFKFAIKKYEKAVELFKNVNGGSEDEKKKMRELEIACHLNLAAAHLKEKGYKKVVEEASKALDLEPSSVKALWRRGVAYTYLSEYISATRDFDSALTIDPDNDAVKSAYSNCKKRMQASDKKDKKRFENLFERLREDEQTSDNPSQTSDNPSQN